MKRMFLAAVLAAVASAPASAATLYVGHGIDGRDLGAARGAPRGRLPGDERRAARSSSADVPFGTFARKIDADLPAGRYDVEVRLADGGSCDGPVAIAAARSSSASARTPPPSPT